MIGKIEIVSSEEIYMVPEDWRQAGDVVIIDCVPLSLQLSDGFLHVDGIPVDNGVHNQAENAQLFFLSLFQSIAYFPSIAVVNFSGQFVPKLLAIELDQDFLTQFFIISKVQDMQGLVDTPQLNQGLGQGCWAISDLENTHNAFSFEVTKLQRSRQTQQVFPIVFDQLDINGSVNELVQAAIISVFVDAPEPSAANVRQPWAEIVAEQPEQSEDCIRVCSRISHDLSGLQFCVLVEQQGQQRQAITQGSWNNGCPQARVLIRQHVVPGDASTSTKVFWVRASMNGTFRSQEPQAISRSDVPIAPVLGDVQFTMSIDDYGVRCLDRFCADKILLAPRQTTSAQWGNIRSNQRGEANIAASSNQDCTKCAFKVLNTAWPVAEMRKSAVPAHCWTA